MSDEQRGVCFPVWCQGVLNLAARKLYMFIVNVTIIENKADKYILDLDKCTYNDSIEAVLIVLCEEKTR